MGYSKTPKRVSPGLGGWIYGGDVALGNPPAGTFFADQTSMSSGAPTIELNVTDDNGIDHTDWLQDLQNTNHLILRERNDYTNALLLEISSNGSGAGFRTLVGDIRSGNGTFEFGVIYDLWAITTSEDFVDGPASSTTNAVPTFSDTTGKELQNNTLLYASGELQAASAVEIQERNTPPANATAKGHVWVRDDIPNTLVFTDDDGADHPISGFVVGPASSDSTAVPTFSDTTGKLIKNNDLLKVSGEVQLTSATAAVEIEERGTAPTNAADKGHVWVKNDAPNVLTFTDDIGTDFPLHGLEKNVALGTWSFGSSTLGTPAAGVFDTDNATLTSITAIRFNGTPNSGQAITSWSTLLPQEGILYLQDITNPGGISVTFHYTSVTFPGGASYPQFNGPILGINGTVHGTNWSANDYSLQIVPVASSLESVILGPDPDNDVTVLSTEPIIFRDNAVNFTPFEIVSTNATATTPSIKVTKQSYTNVAFQAATSVSWISITPTAIQPAANTASHVNYYLDPADTTSGTYHGVDVTFTGGAHTGSQRGGNLSLDGGASTSGTDGSVYIGANVTTEEITLSTGFSIVEGADHPVTPTSTKAQLWLSNDYDETTQPAETIQDGHVLMTTAYNASGGDDIEMSWLAANYKAFMGGTLAFSRLEQRGIVGGTTKSSSDTDVSYFYDHLSNMWYQSFIDASLADAKVSSSSDGGYTWEAFKTVDASIAAGDLAQPCTNGTNLGIAADGSFYLSTDLTAANLSASATGTAGSITGSTGLVWHIGSQLWVMCGDNGVGTGYVYTSPAAGTTWTLRYTFPASVTPVTMDIAHPGYGGYNSTERILIFCGASSADMFWSDNGTSWTQDTGGNPTTGLMHVVWCPSISTNNSANKGTNGGSWLGMDATKNLWVARTNGAGNWDDTSTSADWIWKTDEWCGYGTSSTIATNIYQFVHVADTGAATGGWVRGRHISALYNASLPMHRSSDAGRARFTWGNGVILFDRQSDGEMMIGRYGPIT